MKHIINSLYLILLFPKLKFQKEKNNNIAIWMKLSLEDELTNQWRRFCTVRGEKWGWGWRNRRTWEPVSQAERESRERGGKEKESRGSIAEWQKRRRSSWALPVPGTASENQEDPWIWKEYLVGWLGLGLGGIKVLVMPVTGGRNHLTGDRRKGVSSVRNAQREWDICGVTENGVWFFTRSWSKKHHSRL